MSRIRGIDAKVENDVLQARSHQNTILAIKKKSEDQLTKTKDEVEKHQIQELLHKLPKLDKIFEVHRKIGEGTFSSVYLGSLRQHAELPAAEKRWFAIKHLVPTAHPARIEHELRCLRDMGGQDNVIGVELCLRHLDTIVFIMPYIPHRKFSEYVGDMDAAELRRYMRALMIALRRVHSFGVIHRDVKPSNFLYDRENQRYLLVDFGLAQRLCPASSAPPPAHATRKRTRPEDDGTPDAKRVALDLTTRAKAPSVPAQKTSDPQAIPLGFPTAKSQVWVQCACAGVGGVCAACLQRAAPRAPRAGTQGFRPPEVLLKVPQQSTAVDMWASGVVLSSALCARYPLFRGPDDAAALAELAELLGTRPLQRAARALGRRLVVSSERGGVCLRKLCARARGGPGARCGLCAGPCVCRDHDARDDEVVPGRVTAGFPDSAFALAWRLLDPDPRTRISADEALQHPFLADTT